MRARLRLRSQALVGSRARDATQAVGAMAGLQGQDLEGAKWSIGLRVPKSTVADVERAFSEGELVRTWPMRGTLHVVAAEDVRWLLALTAKGNLRRAAYRRKQLGLDEKTLSKGRKVLERTLRGKHLTREELLLALGRAKVSTEGQRGYHLLWDAAVQGLICTGAPRGKAQTFALLDEWAPKPRALEGDEALAELARRYFTTRGPASLKDFTWWSGLSAREAKRGLEAVKASLEEDDEGFFSPPGLSAPASPTLLALPGFDELLLGYQDRSASLDPKYAPRICPGGNGVFQPTLVLDGRVVGTWRRATRELELFTSLSRPRRRLADEALARYGTFLGKQD